MEASKNADVKKHDSDASDDESNASDVDDSGKGKGLGKGEDSSDRSTVTSLPSSTQSIVYTDALPKISIQPLKSSVEFESWFSNITVLLYSKRLLLLVQGIDTKDAGTPEYAARCRAAFLVLYASLHKSHHRWALDVSNVEGESESDIGSGDCYDPRILWKAIIERFDRVDSTSQDNAMKRYFGARMAPKESIDEYLDRLQALRLQCIKAGCPNIDDDVHINRIATTITRDYNVQSQLFIQTLHAGDSLTLDTVRDALLTAEELLATRNRLDEEVNSSKLADKANFSADLPHQQWRKPSNSRGRGRGRGRGSRGRGRGRGRGGSNKKNNDEEDKLSLGGRSIATLATKLKPEDLHCTVCGRNGHTRHNCPKRYKNYGNCAKEDKRYDDDNDDDDDVDSDAKSRDYDKDYDKSYYRSSNNNKASDSDNYGRKSSNFSYQQYSYKNNIDRVSGLIAECAFTLPTLSIAPIACAYMFSSASSVKYRESSSPIWILDSACSRHSTGNRDLLQSYRAYEDPIPMTIANDETLEIHGEGQFTATSVIGDRTIANTLNVHYVPGMAVNLVSVGMLAQAGFWTMETDKGAIVYDSMNDDRVVMTAKYDNGIYVIDFVNDVAAASISKKTIDINELHTKFGHISERRIRKMMASSPVYYDYAITGTLNDCIACIKGKRKRKPIGKGPVERASVPLELVHSDVCGPISWCSQAQRIIAQSSTEAEYVAMAETSKQAVYLRTLYSVLRIDAKDIPIYSDNQSGLTLAISPISAHHERTKHIDVRYHLIRDLVSRGAISVHYEPTTTMTADLLTKALSGPRIAFLRDLIGMVLTSH